MLETIQFDEIQTNPVLQELTYFYIIHGVIPEIMPRIAYRRIGAEAQYRRKILKCPFCSTRITDVDIGTRVELYGHARRVERKCQLYLRCTECGKEVGINIA